MAQTGVYRESLFETFRPMATKRQIKAAIALTKQFGLHSNPTLRDPDLGTYYQVDPQKYESFQQALKSSAFHDQEDVAQRITQTTQALRTMLAVSGGSAIALTLLGSWQILFGHSETGVLWWTGALCAGGIWALQNAIAKRLL